MGKGPAGLEEAVAHHRAGRLQQAGKIYRRLLVRNPAHADALHLLGLLSYQSGQSEKAVELIREAIRSGPGQPTYYNNLGQILLGQRRPAEAAECFQEVLRRRPDDVDAYIRLGTSYCQMARPADGAASFRQALLHKPDSVEALTNLGHALRLQGQFADAVAALRKALALRPDSPEALCNLFGALEQQGDHAQADAVGSEVLRLHPEMAEAHHNLGTLRRLQGRLVEAETLFREALARKPNWAESHRGLGVALLEQGRPEDAAEAFARSLELEPDHAAAHSNRLLCLHYRTCDPQALFDEHRHWNERHAAPLAAAARPHTNDPDPERPLRIGYLSPDLRAHPVAFFFGPLLIAHDRRQFLTYCYANLPQPDAVTRRLQDLVGAWRDIRWMRDDEVAEQIRADRIDILVDLAGHTGDNRLPVFARRPAPIQVTYLGYPDTTGLAAVDYRFTDAWADPPGETDPLHTEELIRLAAGFNAYQPVVDAPPVSELPALAAGVFTFGSFNNLAKVGPEAVVAWAAILRATPGSRLALKAKALGDAATRERVHARFAEHGIPPERLLLLPPVPSDAHLGAYAQIDLALDTFPYNGTTTTCEALWMGVPVVTLAGRAHASRVGASILSRLDLPACIAETPESYVESAVRLARDTARLRGLRAGMRERMARSPLTDNVRLAREIEQAYRQMWRRWSTRQAAARRAAPQPPPASAEELRRKVAGFPFWYHRIELPGGVVTPGPAPINKDAYKIPADLAGKRVLDVGAWDGFWSFEALRRGARQVVAIDDFSDLLGRLDRSQRRAWEAFDLCRDAFGYDQERCRRLELSVYDVSEDRLGRFDVVFCFGTLYHLRHPLLALDRLAAVCDGEICVESAILDDYSPYRGGLGHGYPGGQMVAEFYPDAQYGDNPTNWWAPTLACLGHLVRAAGFRDVTAWKLTDQPPRHVSYCRGFAKGVKTR